MQDSASFWTDIKNFEEQLAKSPDSFCFARLSDVYLKVGLVDDALHVARQGVIKHPRYLSGQRALSLACQAKGLNDEALAALKLVAEALPEDVSSLKLLGRLNADAGNQDAAIQAFRTALEFAPDDVECQIQLESLDRSATVTESISESDDADEEILEDLELLDEIDCIEEDQSDFACQLQVTSPDMEISAAPRHDPLSTGTLAELYVTQGFIHKALEIYRAILAGNPDDGATAERVAGLEALEAGSSELDAEVENTFEAEVEDEAAFSMPAETFFHKTESETLPGPDGIPAFEHQQSSADISGQENAASVVPRQGGADNSIAMLDGWLENIRRIRSCR